jgi:hypothetical protein
VFRQTAWSVGYCTSCDRFEAFRLGEKEEIARVSGIRVSRETYRRAFCDCCGRRGKPSEEALILPFQDWQPTDGVRSLFKKSAPHLLINVPTLRADGELHALLTVVQHGSALHSVELGRGAVIGLLLGMAAFVPVAISLTQVVGVEPVSFVWVVTMVAGGMVGAICGAIVSAIRKGARTAHERIIEAYHKYELDPMKLAAAADSFPRRIRNAAEELLRDLPEP